MVAGIADFLYQHGANILHADQHQDADLNLFLMRVEWSLHDFDLSIEQFKKEFPFIADQFKMQWRLELSREKHRLAVFCSKYDHCVSDLLYRHQCGEIHCEIPLVISNHPDAKKWADFYKIPFYFIPVEKENKKRAEEKQLELLRKYRIDVIALARYMQILSPQFVKVYPNKIINVHHSFLPAFTGAKPYHQAFQRGVKLIGATSHYVTETLDKGPIIEQDIARISHRDNMEDLIQKGKELEKSVLARAVQWHTEHRILVYAGKTVIFD